MARALTKIGARMKFTGVVHSWWTNTRRLWRKGPCLWISKSRHLLRAQVVVTHPQPHPGMTSQRFD